MICTSCKKDINGIQANLQSGFCNDCYDEAMKGMECYTVKNHLRSCVDCRQWGGALHKMSGDGFPEGSCQECGEPLNNANGDFCFKCQVKKSNV